MVENWGVVAAFASVALGFLGVLHKFGQISVQFGKVWRTTEDTATHVAAMTGSLALLKTEVSEHRVAVAKEYATNADLERAIDRLERTIREYLEATRELHRTK